jgi:hypothetical protein
MAVIVKYVVERHGVEKMTFAQKQDADAYDRMLDMADELFAVLQHSGLTKDEQQAEDLAMYLAQQKDQVLQALGVSGGKTGKAPKAKESSKAADASKAPNESKASEASNTSETNQVTETSATLNTSDENSTSSDAGESVALDAKAA